jgi:hypothetical protein
MSAHTPGPWTAVPSSSKPEGWDVLAPDCSECASDGDVVVVADYISEADARLIATAPDLAIVARAAIRLLTPDQCATLTAEEEAAFGRVEAIAKAEGRS